MKNRALILQPKAVQLGWSIALFFGLQLFSAISADAAFKNDGWAARPLGMGGAFTAVADDVNAPLYNPAGLAQIKSMEATFTHAKLFTGLDLGGHEISLSYSAIARPTRFGSFGLIWANQTVSSLYKEDTFLLNYSQNLNQIYKNLPCDVLVGANFKYLNNAFTLDQRSGADPVFANGRMGRAYALDLGLLIQAKRNALGLAVKNVNSPNIGLKTEDNIPREMIAGYSRSYVKALIFEEAKTAMDISYRDEVDPDLQIKVGGEGYLHQKHLALRLGMAHTQQVNFGLGYNTRNLFKTMELQMDYAFNLPLQVEGTQGSHRMSVTFRFDGSKDQAITVIQTQSNQQKKADLLWELYLRQVNAGLDRDARITFLKKFIKKYEKQSNINIHYAIEELEDLTKPLFSYSR